MSSVGVNRCGQKVGLVDRLDAGTSRVLSFGISPPYASETKVSVRAPWPEAEGKTKQRCFIPRQNRNVRDKISFILDKTGIKPAKTKRCCI